MAGDEDVIEDRPGKCRKCGMDARADAARFGLDLRHARRCCVVADKPGKCPVDGTALVQRHRRGVVDAARTTPTVDKLARAPAPTARR